LQAYFGGRAGGRLTRLVSYLAGNRIMPGRTRLTASRRATRVVGTTLAAVVCPSIATALRKSDPLARPPHHASITVKERVT
jgi:hypothetical protein